MKICILSDDYPSIGRPVYTFIEQLVNNLLNLGVEVVVVAPQSLVHHALRREDLLPKQSVILSTSGKKYHVYRPYFLSFGNIALLNSFVYWQKRRLVEDILKKELPDVLYGHFWHNAFAIDKLAEKYNIPLFVACGEGDDALEILNSGLTDSRRKELSKNISGMISVSTENKRKCIGFRLIDEERVIVLPNCVDTDNFRFDESINIREKLGLDANDFVIAFCGDFEERKGPNRLLEAVKILNDPTIKVIFVGREVQGRKMILSGDNIAFKGTVEHDELPKYLNSADIFVLPTRKEGCCNAIVEALACGLPVVSSNRSFNDDILNDNNSIRVNPDDIHEIAKAIKTFKDNPTLRKNMRDYLILHHSELSLKTRAQKIVSFINSKR